MITKNKLIIISLLVIVLSSYILFLKDGIDLPNHSKSENSREKHSSQKRITTIGKTYQGTRRLDLNQGMAKSQLINSISSWGEKIDLEKDETIKEELILEGIAFFESLPEEQEKSLKYNIANILVKQDDKISIKKLAAIAESAKEDDFNFLVTTTKLLNESQNSKAHIETLNVARGALEANKQYILDESFKNIEMNPESEQAMLVNDSLIFSNQLKTLEGELSLAEQEAN